jgi:hypothetical protein
MLVPLLAFRETHFVMGSIGGKHWLHSTIPRGGGPFRGKMGPFHKLLLLALPTTTPRQRYFCVWIHYRV